MVLFFIFIGVFILVGGVINYIVAMINKKKGTKKELPGLSIAFFVDTVAMIIINIIILRNPMLIFKTTHWGWVLGINIGLFIVSIILAVYLGHNGSKLLYVNSIIMMGATALTLMIFGLCFANRAVYNISSAKEFKVLANLPNKKYDGYAVNIIDDIDFEGVDLKKGLGDKGAIYRIDGQGHSLKNIYYKSTIDSKFLAFFKMDDFSKITNLTIKNSTFEIQPNYFDDKKHEGKECEFSIFGDVYISSYDKLEVELTDVKFSKVKIYVLESDTDIRYEGDSTVSAIYPEEVEGITIHKGASPMSKNENMTVTAYKTIPSIIDKKQISIINADLNRREA